MYNVGYTPFYMAYPLPLFYEEEKDYIRDLEYFDSLYPKETKKCQVYVEQKLHLLDYEGSAIYDEYPDRLHMENMVDMIYREFVKTNDKDLLPKELVRMVTYMEIYKKRHKKTNGILKF